MSLKETCSAYSTPMMDCYPAFKFTKKVGLIELFARYGSQSLALEYLGVDFEHIGISEWNWKSVLAYKKLHFPNDSNDYSSKFSDVELASLLFSFGISSDWNLPMSESEVKRLRNKREIYNAIIATKDHPDISKAKGSDFAIESKADFQTIMTYSFPCQDLSNAGKMAGMDEGSETRSSLLWQVRRIVSEMSEIGQLPDFLLMENVPGVAGEKNLKNLDKWISFLESLGYKNKLQIMEATEYGIPQTRKRAFLVSVLGDFSYQFPLKVKLNKKLKDLLEQDADEKYFLSEKALKYVLSPGTGNFHHKPELNPEVAKTINADTSYQRAGIENYVTQEKSSVMVPLCLNPKVNGKQPSIENRVYSAEGVSVAVTTSFLPKCETEIGVRMLTPKERFRLMGVSDGSFSLIKEGFADSVLYHLAGDSIVTTCLMAIFSQCFGIDWQGKAKEGKLI